MKMLLLFWFCLSICSLLCAAQSTRCPSNMIGCRCTVKDAKLNIRCDGFSGSPSQFKDNLQILYSYEVNELVINDYRSSYLPEEPFNNTVVRKIVISNSPSLRSFGSSGNSAKTFFENIGNTLESLSLMNVPKIRSTEWLKISTSIVAGIGPVVPPTPVPTPATDSSTSTTPIVSPTTDPSLNTSSTPIASPTTDPSLNTSSTPIASPTTDPSTTPIVTHIDGAKKDTSEASGKQSDFKNNDHSFNGRLHSSMNKIDSFQINAKANVPALKELIIQNNPDSTFKDLTVFAAMTSIEKIVMKRIGLSGPFRADLSVFTSLQTLDMSENRITRFDPKNIPKTLKSIDLSNNLIIKFEKTFLNTLTQTDYSSILINVQSNNLNCQCDYIRTIVDQLQGVFDGTCVAPPLMVNRPFGKDCSQTYSAFSSYLFS